MSTLLEISQTVESAYCEAKPAYYNGDCRKAVLFDPDKPTALDLELKFLANGEWVCKQVREFHGR
jgi:hypothetical protein